MGRKSSGQDKGEGTLDKAKDKAKEAARTVTGDDAKKSEGRSDQTKGTAKEKKGKLKDLFKQQAKADRAVVPEEGGEFLEQGGPRLEAIGQPKGASGAVEFLKAPRADKRALALKVLSNQKMRWGAVELLKNPDVRTMQQQTAQRFCHP